MNLKATKITLLGLLAIALLMLPYLAANLYTLHIFILIGIYIITGMGLNIVFGYAGQISLGHGAYFAIGAYVSAILTTRLGLPFEIAFICAGVISFLFGLGIGIPTLKLEGSYLAMATIGFSEIVRMVLINWEALSGGPAGISKIPDPSIFGIAFHTLQSKYYLVLGVFVVGFICYRNLIRSGYGKQLMAVRENPLAAAAMGVDTARIKVLAFALSTLYAGIAGCLYAHLNRYVAPDAFHIYESVTLLLIVVLGGRGSILGPILGAVLLIEMKESLRMLKDYNMLIFGLSLKIFMIYMPNGLMGLKVFRLWNWVRRRDSAGLNAGQTP